MLRRVEIETDDVRRLRLEVGIRRAHVALQPMRLQARVAPRPGDDGVLQPSDGPTIAWTNASPRAAGPAASRQECGLATRASAPWASSLDAAQ